jgi:heterodisulfide reductase subunit D
MTIASAEELAAQLRQAGGESPYLCYQCQRCSSGCPTAAAMGIPPSRMMRLAQLGQGERLVAEASIWRCLGCDSCTAHCPYEVSVRRLVELLRQKAMQEHYLAGRQETFAGDESLARGIQALGRLGGRVRQFRNVSGEDNAARLAWTANLAQQPQGLDRQAGAETVYFVGCVSAMFPMSYGIPQSFASLLAKSGRPFTTLGSSEWCCGFPLLMAGQLPQARELMEHNLDQVRALGARRLVLTCPSCYHMWKHVYPHQLAQPLGFEVLTASQFLRDLVAGGSLRFGEPRRPGIVTYHDPCDLGRKGGHYEEPRQVLASVPGFQFVEMENSREHALCCGGGGDLETFSPELTAEVAARRVAQAAAVQASYLVSACPQCVRTLTKAAKARELRIRVLDLVQFVDAAALAAGGAQGK